MDQHIFREVSQKKGRMLSRSIFECIIISSYNLCKMLVKLGIWSEANGCWQLDATFRNNLTSAIFGG